MDNYLNIFNNIFNTIITKYGLLVEQRDTNTIMLRGSGYALEVIVSRDGVSLYYQTNNSYGELLQYDIDSYISSQFTLEDRKEIGNPQTIEEIIIAELKVTASGLLNHFENILKGYKKWIDVYEQSPFAVAPRILR